MPLELWLECICDQTQFGEDLVVVGNHPVLGNWSVEKGVVLRTDVSTFPLWTLEKPLVLEEDEYMPLWLEYKYIIRGIETHWEDFGRRSLPIFSSTSPVTATAFLPQWTEVGKPMNRLLPFCRGRRLKPGLMLRVDSYGSWTAMTEASWNAPKRFSPGVAGMSAALRRSSFLFVSGSTVNHESIKYHAERVFARPKRARLLLCLRQLRRSDFGMLLAPELWLRIGDFIGGLRLRQVDSSASSG
ncbi:unnamed protein product [Cladocopium goreaui]|uniref:CBM20 domain-containing protein n=1 Tax=Cladocopium goreaui TaxID=2562237 RepID=A0A9P1GAC6_9DINO|nr:unnamed protein product [Cladocopium goreaui]